MRVYEEINKYIHLKSEWMTGAIHTLYQKGYPIS